MHNLQLFYRYYDTLFASKDYAGEVEAVFSHCAKYPLRPLKHILEIGCGTGNHTVELAQMPGVHVTAVDIDQEMLALAKSKASQASKTNITFVADGFAEREVDLCVALFNVVNYVCGEEHLHAFFAGIAASLRSQGIFIFDCWNGAAALLDPPGSKNYEQHADGLTVSCHLTSETDIANKITSLLYRLELFDESGEKIESGYYRIEHKLWTPAQIKDALKQADLEVATVCIPFQFEQVATDTDWKIMFVCQKVKAN